MRTDQTAPKTIDEYMAGFPDHIQRILQKIRATIRRAAPQAEEAIRYQMPTFRLEGNLVHFAAFKNHIGLFRHLQEPRGSGRTCLPMRQGRARSDSRWTSPFPTTS